MSARSTAPRLRPSALAFVISSLLASSACNEGTPEPEGLRLRSQPRDPAGEASARVEAFVAAPDWAKLIALLGQRHEVARELLGPHYLHYDASFYTGPADLPRDEPLPDIAVDQPIHERFTIEDRLELRWAAAPGEEPRFHLDQRGGEPGSSRGMIVIGEQAWAQLDDRGWYARPLDGDLWMLWLDDAQHAVLDLVELAGPQAEFDRPEPIELGGRSALRVVLRRSEVEHPERVIQFQSAPAGGELPSAPAGGELEAPRAWRSDASIDAISGEVVIDRATGLWLAAKLEVAWHFDDRAGREVRGTAKLDAELEPLAVAPAIDPPESAKPLPERERPEILRERLLDGLAAP